MNTFLLLKIKPTNKQFTSLQLPQPVLSKSTQAPPTLQSGSGWAGAGSDGGVIACVESKGTECSRIAAAGGCAGGTSVVAEPSACGQPTTAAPPLELRAHMVPSCSSIAPLWGKGHQLGEERMHTLKGTKPAWTQHPGLLLHQSESNLTLSTAVIAQRVGGVSPDTPFLA